jgi:hypothetical protein
MARMGEERKVCKILVGKLEVRRPLGRPRRRWEAWIRMDLGEIGSRDVEWIQLAQERGRWRAVVNAEMNLRVWHHEVTLLVIDTVFRGLFQARCVRTIRCMSVHMPPRWAQLIGACLLQRRETSTVRGLWTPSGRSI